MSNWIIDNRGKYNGRTIRLLTPSELKSQPAGKVLISILGEEKTVGVDHLDDDTRCGYTAWGILNEN